ncbi:MAG: hypothetical protein ACLFQV_12580 [Vulcanimicrobiota bacterium]
MKSQNKKKILIFFIITTLVIAFFQFTFLFDFSGADENLTQEKNQGRMPLFFLIITLALLPSFIAGYGKFHPLVGFIPPFLLMSLFWFLIIHQMKISNISLAITGNQVYKTAFFTTVIISCFGIILTSATGRIRKEKTEKTTEQNQPAEQTQTSTTVNEKEQAELENKISEKPTEIKNDPPEKNHDSI